jgi:uncharacterized protein (DUF1330 family)
MSVYVIADVRWRDPDARQEYAKHAGSIVAHFGGRYLVGGGQPEPLEGGWELSGISLIEFPTREDARHWYDSAQYRPLRSARLVGAETRAVLVESKV